MFYVQWFIFFFAFLCTILGECDGDSFILR